MALMRAGSTLCVLFAVLALAAPACSRDRSKILAGPFEMPTHPVIVGNRVYLDTVVSGPVGVRGVYLQEHFRVEVPLNGDPPRTSALEHSPAPDPALATVASTLGEIGAAVRDGSDLYVGTTYGGNGKTGADKRRPAGTLSRIHSDGAPVVLASNQDITALVLDATSIYWLNGGFDGSGQLVRLSRAGGSPVVLASREDYPSFIALDETRIYWASDRGTIRTMEKTGGWITTLASFHGRPTGLAVGPDLVVWTMFGVEEKRDLALVLPGVLMAVPK